MVSRIGFAVWVLVAPQMAAGSVLPALAPFLINHYTFDDPLGGDPQSPVELDLGSDATPIQLVNGAPRVADAAWWGSQYSLETGQRNTGPNDDWKAGVLFPSSAASTLTGTNHVTGVTIMGWFKPLGTVENNPSPNTNTEDPDDRYNAFGLAGLLHGDDGIAIDGHSVRALLEVINGKVTGLGRRLDDQINSGQRASEDDWQVVMPPGQWTHLAATFNFDASSSSSAIRLYKNGELIDMTNASVSAWQRSPGVIDYTSSTNAGGIKIGGSFPENSEERNPFNGRIDELMFFNKSLSPTEVLAQFELISDLPGDFNRDGRVDAGDYVRWRNHLGDADEAAIYHNGDGGGVALSDYLWWKQHYLASASGSGGLAPLPSTKAVPEPTAWLLALAIVAALPSFCARRRSDRGASNAATAGISTR